MTDGSIGPDIQQMNKRPWKRAKYTNKKDIVHATLSSASYMSRTLFAWLISHQPAVLFSQNKPATSNQPAVFFSQNKSAPAISHQPNEQVVWFSEPCHNFCFFIKSLPVAICQRNRAPSVFSICPKYVIEILKGADDDAETTHKKQGHQPTFYTYAGSTGLHDGTRPPELFGEPYHTCSQTARRVEARTPRQESTRAGRALLAQAGRATVPCWGQIATTKSASVAMCRRPGNPYAMRCIADADACDAARPLRASRTERAPPGYGLVAEEGRMPSRRHKTLASASPIRYYDLSLSVFVKGFRDVGPGRRAEYCLLPLLRMG
jgi:hypothetical protein